MKPAEIIPQVFLFVFKADRLDSEDDYLTHLAYEGANRLYGDPVPHEVDERISYEMGVIKSMGFPGDFLIVQDFINAARNELGVWVGDRLPAAAQKARRRADVRLEHVPLHRQGRRIGIPRRQLHRQD